MSRLRSFFAHTLLWVKSFVNLSATDELEKKKTANKKQLISSGGWHQKISAVELRNQKKIREFTEWSVILKVKDIYRLNRFIIYKDCDIDGGEACF